MSTRVNPNLIKEIKSMLDYEARIPILKKTIEDVQKLISEFAELGATRDELTKALKFSFELSKLDPNTLNSSDIRKIRNYAEEIHEKKNIIQNQQRKLKQLTTQLNDKHIAQLEEKLSLIVSSFDSYISDISERIAELSDRGTTMLFFREYKDEASTEHKIAEISSNLKEDINFIKTMVNETESTRKEIRKSFITYIKTKSSAVKGKQLQNLANLLLLTKEEISEKLKDKKIKEELVRLFKIIINCWYIKTHLK